MKTSWFFCLAGGLLLLVTGTPGWAQQHGTRSFLADYLATETNSPAHRFAEVRPQKPKRAGYWIVETNAIPRGFSVVRFYDGHSNLVYEEGLVNFFPDLNRSTHRRTARHLATVLQRVLRAPVPQVSRNLLAQQLGSRGRIPRPTPLRQLARAAE